jgi:hypothetical protein
LFKGLRSKVQGPSLDRAFDLGLLTSFIHLRTSMRTVTTPSRIMSSFSAAFRERSMIRPSIKGPRSLIRTSTLRPFLRFSTRTIVLKGRVRWAAVNDRISNFSPLAVLLLWNFCPYQEASPVWKPVGIFGLTFRPHPERLTMTTAQATIIAAQHRLGFLQHTEPRPVSIEGLP